ncbi:hypothetical protein M5K25_004691 [Dendrobium thyrsiflorum]|uniref:Uncharacterized protein n=1 Tax=Dendrobium thyrsiflorum TaxID=117978 RepID=A0ABD0VFN9_DENTH
MEYVNANMRSAQGFKDSVYQGAAQKMKEKFRIKAFPKDAAYLNIAIANYVVLEIVCGLGHATGEWAKSGNSQTPLATQQIHVGDDEPSQFMDIGADGSIPTEWSDMQVMEDSTTTTKKPLPSSSKGGGIKRKCKTSGIDQDIRECISLMADSVNEVANAIKSSTSPQQIRNMYTELIIAEEFLPSMEKKMIDIHYVWHNYSFDSHILENRGIKVSGFHADTMHLARLWDSSRRIDGGYSLEALTSDPIVMSGTGFHTVYEFMGKISMKSLFRKRKVKKDGSEGKSITIAPVEHLQRKELIPWICYSVLDSINTLKLYESLKAKLEAMDWVFYGICKGSMYEFYEEY